MRKHLIVILLLFTAILSIFKVTAVPMIPHQFYGTVTQNGSNVPDNTNVSVWIVVGSEEIIIGSNLTVTMNGKSVYSLYAYADDIETPDKDGAVENDQLHFKVEGINTTYSSTWKEGETTNIELVLIAPTSTTITTSTSTSLPSTTLPSTSQPSSSTTTTTTKTTTSKASTTSEVPPKPTSGFQVLFLLSGISAIILIKRRN